MYSEQLKNRSPQITVVNEEDFRNLMTEVDEETVITQANPERVYVVEDGSSENYAIQNEVATTGDIVLVTDEGHQPVISSAIDSIIARADLTCRLIAELFNRNKVEDGISLLNDGLKLRGEIRKEDQAVKTVNPCQIVTRSGWVIGAMSNQWAHLPQSRLAEVVLDEIRKSFPDAEFERCHYTHELTEFWISLGNHQSEIMKKYRNGWVSSGYAESDLEKVKPLLRVCTSDTGQSGVVVTPILQDGNYNRVLGERLSTKHAGKNSLDDVRKDLNQAFAKAQESLEKISNLMSTPIQNPVPVLVRALEHGKRSLWSLTQGGCEDILDHFNMLYRGVSGISAYDIYATISELEWCEKVKNLKHNSAIQIVEAIYRLIDLDWKGLDAPGKQYLGDGLKKKGGRP